MSMKTDEGIIEWALNSAKYFLNDSSKKAEYETIGYIQGYNFI
jgi:hypothetical protein